MMTLSHHSSGFQGICSDPRQFYSTKTYKRPLYLLRSAHLGVLPLCGSSALTSSAHRLCLLPPEGSHPVRSSVGSKVTGNSHLCFLSPWTFTWLMRHPWYVGWIPVTRKNERCRAKVSKSGKLDSRFVWVVSSPLNASHSPGVCSISLCCCRTPSSVSV